MKKTVQLILAFLIFIPAAASAMPPHPKLMNTWKSEGTVDANLAVLNQMKAMGIDKPVKSFPHNGPCNVLIILMNFADRPMDAGSTPGFYDNVFTVDSLSWKKYYSDMSDGALDLNFTIVGPYTAAHNYDYYGGGDAIVPPASINNPWDMIPPFTVVFGIVLLLVFARKTRRLAPALVSLVVLPSVLILAPSCGGGGGTITSPTKAPQLVREAVDLVYVDRAHNSVNFADFDNDSDGTVDSVIVIHQGPGEEVTGFPSDIWSHQWNLSAQHLQVTHDGVTINDYAMMPEYHMSAGDTTIGVFCHEFGHILGLPDLYDTINGTDDVGDWSLMAGGSWNGPSRNGEVPAPLLAWERNYLGWLTFTEITPTAVSATISVDDIESTPRRAARITLNKINIAGTDYSQYLIAENIVPASSPWNEYRPGGLSGGGLLITVIDDVWNVCRGNIQHNTVNSYSVHGVRIIEADGDYNVGNATDTFYSGNETNLSPGASQPNSNYQEYNSTAVPSATIYGGNSGLYITDVSSKGDPMTFKCYTTP